MQYVHFTIPPRIEALNGQQKKFLTGGIFFWFMTLPPLYLSNCEVYKLSLVGLLFVSWYILHTIYLSRLVRERNGEVEVSPADVDVERVAELEDKLNWKYQPCRDRDS